MRRYVITCDFHNPYQDHKPFGKQIRLIDPGCDQPHSGVWIIRSPMSASDLRHSLLPFLGADDKLFVCEAGLDMAGFGAVEAPATRNVVQFTRRNKSSMLTSVLAAERDRKPRMLTGAIGGSLQ